jgi:hypothetical protein
MLRPLLALAVLLVVLLGADRTLARRERARRSGDPAVERLVSSERAGGGKIAAITIGSAGGDLFYARKKGLWRSREAHGAICGESAVRELLAAFLEARGVARAEGGKDAALYGFGSGKPLAVTLHGPKALDADDQDVLLSFEVGRSFAEGARGRAFVRETGSGTILEIDRDPRRLVELPMGSLLPPLVDTRILAGCLGDGFRGFREFRIETPGNGSVSVAVDPSAAGPSPTDPDAPAWTLDRGKGRENFPGWRVGGYIGLWLRGRFEETESPARAKERGFDPPAAIVHITPEGSDPIELWISRVDDRNRALAWNKSSNVVMIVPGRWQPLLAPSAEMFLDTGRPNPWEEWLRKPSVDARAGPR